MDSLRKQRAYVRSQRRKGVSDAKISEKLSQQGYDSDLIDTLLATKPWSWKSLALITLGVLLVLSLGLYFLLQSASEPVDLEPASVQTNESVSEPVVSEPVVAANISVSEQQVFEALLSGDCSGLPADQQSLCDRVDTNPESTLLSTILLSGDVTRCDELSTDSYIQTCKSTLG